MKEFIQKYKVKLAGAMALLVTIIAPFMAPFILPFALLAIFCTSDEE